jgi:hypothetical protein
MEGEGDEYDMMADAKADDKHKLKASGLKDAAGKRPRANRGVNAT